MDPIRLLIVDDHACYREGVRTILLGLPDMEVIGEASGGDDTIARAETLQPDVILMDINGTSFT